MDTESDPLDDLIDESIRLELNTAALYRLFAEELPEDNGFWGQLHLEEKSHAALIRAARDSFAKRGKFPVGMLARSVEEVRAANRHVESMVTTYGSQPPARREACEAALAIEQEAGETHFLQFMEKQPESAVETVFQQLNRGDKAHERRIREHLGSLPPDA